MKFTKKITAIILAVIMVMTLLPSVAFASQTPSGWAVESVEEAKRLGLATPDLLNDFSAATTRIEFCRAAVNLLRKYGYDVDSVTPKMFSDTNDRDIGIAAALGITNGTDVERNLFSPDGTLTREQAVTLLNNVLSVIGKRITSSPVAWTDVANISSWALQSTSDMYNCGVVSGTDTTKLVFSPKTPYTHEQSIVTLLRMWVYIKPSAETASAGTASIRNDVKVIDKVQSDLFIAQAEPVELLDNGNMVIALPSTFNVNVGDTFIIQPNEQNPYGFMGKVESKNGNKIEVSQPYLDEVFEKIDVNIGKELKPEEIKSLSLEDGVTLDTSHYFNVGSATTSRNNVTYANYIQRKNDIQYSPLAFIPPEIGIDIPSDTGDKLLFNIDLIIYDDDEDPETTSDQIRLKGKLGYGNLRLDYDMNYMDDWKIHAILTGSEVSQIVYDAKGDYEISLAKLLNRSADGKVGTLIDTFAGVSEEDKIVLGSATWDIATMIVQAHGGEPMSTMLAVSLQFTTTISGEISGEILIGYDYENVFKRGFQFEGRKLSGIKEDTPKSGILIEGEATAKTQTTIGGDVVLYVLGCPIAKITNDIGAFAEAKGKLRYKTGERVTGDGSAEFSIKAIGELKAQFTYRYEWFGEEQEINLFNAKVTLYDKTIFGPWKWPQSSWSGTWKLTGSWGDSMTLTQNGNNVTGIYDYQEGTISGTVLGNVFTGTWEQPRNKRKGGFEFTMSDDGMSFTVKWWYDNSLKLGERVYTSDIGRRLTPIAGSYSPVNTQNFNVQTYSVYDLGMTWYEAKAWEDTLLQSLRKMSKSSLKVF